MPGQTLERTKDEAQASEDYSQVLKPDGGLLEFKIVLY